MSPTTRVAPVTCLGCGCGCDDLAVEVADGRIASVAPPCPLAQAWFGDGRVPSAVRRAGADAPLDAALSEAAELLARGSGRVLVVLAPDITSQAQRAATRIAVCDRSRQVYGLRPRRGQPQAGAAALEHRACAAAEHGRE